MERINVSGAGELDTPPEGSLATLISHIPPMLVGNDEPRNECWGPSTADGWARNNEAWNALTAPKAKPLDRNIGDPLTPPRGRLTQVAAVVKFGDIPQLFADCMVDDLLAWHLEWANNRHGHWVRPR